MCFLVSKQKNRSHASSKPIDRSLAQSSTSQLSLPTFGHHQVGWWTAISARPSAGGFRSGASPAANSAAAAPPSMAAAGCDRTAAPGPRGAAARPGSGTGAGRQRRNSRGRCWWSEGWGGPWGAPLPHLSWVLSPSEIHFHDMSSILRGMVPLGTDLSLRDHHRTSPLLGHVEWKWKDLWKTRFSISARGPANNSKICIASSFCKHFTSCLAASVLGISTLMLCCPLLGSQPWLTKTIWAPCRSQSFMSQEVAPKWAATASTSWDFSCTRLCSKRRSPRP